MDKDPTKALLRRDLQLVLQIAWNLGWIIAIPAVVFVFTGAYLDRMLMTSPIFVIAGLLVAMALSGWGIYRKVKVILNTP